LVRSNHQFTERSNHQFTERSNHQFTERSNHQFTERSNHQFTERSNHQITEPCRLPLPPAFELAELGPSLVSLRKRPAASSPTPGVQVGAWHEADGSTLIIAVNLNQDWAVASLEVEYNTSMALSSGMPSTLCPAANVAVELFGTSAARTVTNVSCALVGDRAVLRMRDMVDGLSTRIYRLPPPVSMPQPPPPIPNFPPTDPHAHNLIFNGGFESSSSGPGTADGFWAAWGGDPAATHVVVTDVVQEGRHAMRIRTPATNRGLRMWTLPIKAPMLVGETYELSFWAKAEGNAKAEGSDRTKGDASKATSGVAHLEGKARASSRSDGNPVRLLVGMEAMFGKSNVSCPDGSYGQCSYTPQSLELSKNWSHHKLQAKCQFVPDRTGYTGGAGMVSIELPEVGVAWVDQLRLQLVSAPPQ
jgi:hypothetical protein